MNKKQLVPFLLLALLILAFPSYRLVKRKVKKYRLSHTYNIVPIPKKVKQKKHFVIIVPSYNNEAYYERNLSSIFEQTYPNYRVIYVDDCSTDDTYRCVQSYVTSRNLEKKLSLIRNKKNKGALANLYQAIHTCRNDEIIVIVDGDDWLASPFVLEKLNIYYNSSKVWMTYGQYLEYPSYKLGISRSMDLRHIKKSRYRKTPWITSHLRTFYAGLFKRIKKEDLQYKDKFFSTTYDLAITFPMLEMAREHAFFVEDITYIYNNDSPINDGKINRDEQMFFEWLIRKKPSYKKLHSHPSYL